MRNKVENTKKERLAEAINLFVDAVYARHKGWKGQQVNALKRLRHLGFDIRFSQQRRMRSVPR